MHRHSKNFSASIFLLLTFFISSVKAGTWEIVRQSDWEFSLSRVKFRDLHNGYIAGLQDQLLLTNDGGNTWKRHRWPDSLLGTAIDAVWGDMHFSSTGDLWLSGSSGYFLKITSETQSFQFYRIPNQPELSGAFSIVGEKIWAGGYYGSIYYSSDSGQNWQQIADLTTSESILWDIHFIDSSKGFVLIRTGIDRTQCLRTRDGGRTWSPIDNAAVHGRRFYFIGERHGWVLGEFNEVFLTSDGGENWERVHVTDDTKRFHALFFVNDRIGWLGGEKGLFFKTTDGGKSWKRTAAPTLNKINDIYFINEQIGWVVADWGLIARSDNGGESWKWQIKAPSNNLYGVHFIDHRTGCAVGDNIFIRTENAGHTWAQSDSITGNEIQFVDQTTGWINGFGDILRTGDGGKSWEKVHHFDNDTITAIHFINRENGWALSGKFKHSKLFATNDGGISWEHISTFPYFLSEMDFISVNKGWIIGSAGRILRTEDGGRSWKLLREKEETLYTNLNALDFIDDLHGWVVGFNGLILATADGGDTWIQQNETAYFEDLLMDVQFLNRNEGWAVGLNGDILHTVNGGRTWTREHSEYMGYWWADAHFTDANHGWSVGLYGAVNRYLDPTVVKQQMTQLENESLYHPLQIQNPIRHSTTLVYTLPYPADIQLEIYDFLGKRVRVIEASFKNTGTYSVLWDLRDDSGFQVACGTYFCCLRINNKPFIKKITIIR
ncbi:MAG: YCF48-related protein [candidate division KSB1 bacterium]|nr:YCF48-related protein [candidate division KSB1 bacterium]